MKRLIQWHSGLLDNITDRFGLSVYQIAWLAFVKGLFIGYIIGAHL